MPILCYTTVDLHLPLVFFFSAQMILIVMTRVDSPENVMLILLFLFLYLPVRWNVGYPVRLCGNDPHDAWKCHLK